MPEPIVFIPGVSPASTGLLARYLPPLPEGIATAWLQRHLPRGEKETPAPWVLDPFNAAPHLTVEIARAGYRVLVAANNPVTRFLLELTSRPATEAEYRAALADLAATRTGEERLEPFIRGLYLTPCAQCGQMIEAEAFLWEREAEAPYGRIYHCPQCGDSGERPASSADADRATHLAATELHRARALVRIAPPNDPDRTHIEEALSAYPARAVYVLFTLINKLESLPAASLLRRNLTALILYALDRANTLWPHPTARARPRQLSTPNRYRENNIWFALEEAVTQLNSDGPALAVVSWPNGNLPNGGIAIYEGRLKEMAATLSGIEIAAVIAALPRPNQAFWTLSALWAGWLWGREAVESFKSVLRRRRYDWAWHCTALSYALKSLYPQLTDGTPFFGLIGEVEPGFLSAAMIAAASAAFELRGMALQTESGQAQILWERGKEHPPKSEVAVSPQEGEWQQKATRLCREAARVHLHERGEPGGYLYLHAAALTGLVQADLIPISPEQSPADLYSQAMQSLEAAFIPRGEFVRYGGSEKSLETGQWGLPQFETTIASLADRVEMTVVRYLQKHAGCTLADIAETLYASFPALLTPDISLARVCLESYGEQIPAHSGSWQLRAQDSPRTRRADLKEMRALLGAIAEKLGLRAGSQDSPLAPLLWREDEEIVFVFYVLASAIIGKIVLTQPHPPQKSVIVLPGGRAGLVVHKLRRDPRLRQATETGWRFLKFRQLRWLAEMPQLSRELLVEQLALDPLAEEDPQMRLL